MAHPSVLILHATGTNRDREAAWAVEGAGGRPTILHVNELRTRPAHLHDFAMLILPGGFSYGDALGAGRLLATDMRWLFQDELGHFIGAGKPVLGICNGFQALVKSAWLPGPPQSGIQATLTRNASNRFECRWVWLEPDAQSPCVFTRGLEERIHCPVAHGEGRFVPRDDAAPLAGRSPEQANTAPSDGFAGDGLVANGVLERLRAGRQIALTYVAANGGAAAYPANPNGSVAGIAGICNEQGNVLGLMPHPEDHIVPEQHPHWTRGEAGGLGLALFVQGLRYADRL